MDHIVVGKAVGYTGLAALGVGWPIFAVVVVFISSLHTGMGVLIARFAGANEHRKVGRVVYQSLLACTVLGVLVFPPIGYALSPWLLGLVNAAPEVQQEALPYLRTLFLSCWGVLMFFMISGAFRAGGDAQTPMRLGFAMTAINLVLSLVLVRGFYFIPALGTVGAALGTTLANSATAAYGIYHLARGGSSVSLNTNRWGPDWKILSALFRFGLPSGVQGLVMAVGAALLVGYIGGLEQSAEAQAAYSVAYGQLFSFINWIGLAIMSAAATVAGQNLGARSVDRAARTAFSASMVGVVVTAPIAALFLFIPRQLLQIFDIKDEQVLQIGEELLVYLSGACILLVIGLAYTGALQGTGDTRSPLIVALVSKLLAPLGLCALFDLTIGLTAPRIWIAVVFGFFLRAVMSVRYFQRGKWRDIQVDIGPSMSTHYGLQRPDPSQLVGKSGMLRRPRKGAGQSAARH